jgi:predicted CoA-substrate-specific enzyme activase
MITLGLDIGSLFSKAVILRDDKIVSSEIRETTGNVAREIEDLVKETLDRGGLANRDVEVVVSTGHGRDLVKQADFCEDDVSCIAMATRHFLPEVSLSIDIGGQSISTILSDPAGEVLDFMRNDKCASGSGRFIEVMSGALGIPLDRIDETVDQARQRISISSQCGVFAESEVISHLNQGKDVADILAGICHSVASIAISQAMRFGIDENYTVTGGVGRIRSIPQMMEERLKGRYHPFPISPQLAAAYGAAIIGSLE